MFWGRFTELEYLTLDKENLDTIQSLKLENTSDSDQTLAFHSYTIAADKEKEADGVAYINF